MNFARSAIKHFVFIWFISF